MSRTLTERMRSREGAIAAWVFTVLAWGALALMSMAAGISDFFAAGIPNLSIPQSLAIAAVAATAMVFGIIGRRSHPIAATIPVILTAPLVLILGGGGLMAVGWLMVDWHVWG